jgi:hypothetical protein
MTDWDATELGLRSYAYAGSEAAIGNVPVVCDGKPFPAIVRVLPETVAANCDCQLTEPSTAIFVKASNVFAAVSIHGPFEDAPPPPNVVVHE